MKSFVSVLGVSNNIIISTIKIKVYNRIWIQHIFILFALTFLNYAKTLTLMFLNDSMVTLTLSRKIPDDKDDVKQLEQKLGNNTKDKPNETQTMIILLCRINQS